MCHWGNAPAPESPERALSGTYVSIQTGIPQTMRSITHHSRAQLASCGGLALLLAGSALAGCGGSLHKSTTSPVARQQAVGHTTGTAIAQRRSATTTHDRQATAAGAAGKVAQSTVRSGGARSAGKVSSLDADSSAPKISAGPVLRTFSGTGDAGLGLLSEKTAIVLQWNTDSRAVQIFTAQGFRLVSSPAPSGRVRLTRGRYPGLRIATKGPWTIQLRAVA